MNHSALKDFARTARTRLLASVKTQLDRALNAQGAFRDDNRLGIEQLREEIALYGREEVIERAAYTWFNRICALRFMDMNGYTPVRIVSYNDGESQPALLAESKAGFIPEPIRAQLDQRPIFHADFVLRLLSGAMKSDDAQAEAYRYLVVAACNHFHQAMPFLFERIADYTELLLPLDLLSADSIVGQARKVLDQETCQNVEVIGWLYQYYISERKDQVIGSKQAIPKADIPAATQLFTPHWIVRYLVENSLGRLWLLNHPESRLADHMPYYLPPTEPETDFLRVDTPQALRVLDPACGSGHMLVYAFDLLMHIYAEVGYAPSTIPALILEHNLYGIDIDPRAAELAAFALTMKARAHHRRYFNDPKKPNILPLRDLPLDNTALKAYHAYAQRQQVTLSHIQLTALFHALRDASQFGSLLRLTFPHPERTLKQLEQIKPDDASLSEVHKAVCYAVTAAAYLSPRYHVVVGNPPYMGSKNQNADIKRFLQDEYKDVKSDLFSAFIVRNLELSLPNGQLGFMTPFTWMFISSYEKLREFLIDNKTITSLIQLEYSGFDGATVPICTFTLENSKRYTFKGGFVRLSDFRGSENQAPRALEAIQNPDCGWFYRASASDFRAIPGSPIAYWVSERVFNIFYESEQLAAISEIRVGLDTGDNELFIRHWYELSFRFIAFGFTNQQDLHKTSYKWVPHTKGGEFRKWFGNLQDVIAYDLNTYQKLSTQGNKLPSREFYFREGLFYSRITSSLFSVKYAPLGCIFNSASPTFFPNADEFYFVFALLNSKLLNIFSSILSPTLNFQAGELRRIPIPIDRKRIPLEPSISKLISISQEDWNSYETSWDFKDLPLLRPAHRAPTLEGTYAQLRAAWQAMTDEMHALETENNRLFIEAYGLADELSPDVPLSEVTLTCNPDYRYGGDLTPEQREARLLADTLKEFISYAVGCMFGRYALEREGLVLANQGQTQADYLRQVPNPSFMADADNVIPLLEDTYFEDDLTERFKEFVALVFGQEPLQENLRFIERGLGKDIRTYLVRDFYDDHLKRYKKRPIYWLFASEKGAFKALVYLHRITPSTVSVVLNQYLRPYRQQIETKLAHLNNKGQSGNTREQAQATKEKSECQKVLMELERYERNVMTPLASQSITLDLDDGVKVNYLKFGAALHKIKGLEGSDE